MIVQLLSKLKRTPADELKFQPYSLRFEFYDNRSKNILLDISHSMIDLGYKEDTFII